MFNQTKFVSDPLVLSGESSNSACYLAEGGRLREFFKIHCGWHNKGQEYVAMLLARKSPESATRRLNYVNAALLGIDKRYAVNGGYINALCQTTCVSHKAAFLTYKLAQKITALSC